jgi:hypothetical protein
VPTALHTNILLPTPENTVRCVSESYTETKSIKVKVKSTLEQATKAHSHSRSLAALFLTEALEGVGGQRQHSATTPPGKSDTHCVGGWWAPGLVWMGAENLAPTGFDPRTVHPVTSGYTD